MSETLSYEATHRTVPVDGIPFSYHEAGEGQPLILLHGSGPGVSAWSNFQYNLPVFARDFRVLMPDMPGFGQTPLPPIDEVYPTFAATWIARWMAEIGLASANVVGNSMGGYVSVELAIHHPERVRRMALMGPGGFAVSIFGSDPSEGGKRLFEFLDDPTRERMVAWVDCMVADRNSITDELIDERLAAAHAPGAISRTRQIFASLRDPALVTRHQPPWQRANSITTPTLIIWGRDDRMLPYDQAHFAVRHLPDVELHTFARCGHWAQVERKYEFERIVSEFFSRT